MTSTVRATAELHHLGYVVREMDPAIRRFVAEGAVVRIGATDDPIQGVRCALLDTVDGTAIELVAPLDPDDSPVAGRLRRGGGLDHVCYSVTDVAAALAEEEEDGATIVCEPVPAVTFGETVGFALRRSGLLVEYMSRAT